MRKILKGDQVVVLAGKDRGKQGVVIRVLNDRVYVEGINILRKHKKPNPMKGELGGIVEQSMSIHVSNVSLLNPKTGMAHKVGFKKTQSGQKVRYFRSTDDLVQGREV